MVMQRRYSVTGQTPPDDAEAMKADNRSPKLQALDTTAPSTSCGLCEGGAEASRFSTTSSDGGAEQARGRKVAQDGTIVRTSSKRSATQLPSPSSPSHELPPKMARYLLRNTDDVDMDTDTDTDSDSDATDVFRHDDDMVVLFESHGCLPDAASLQKLQLSPEDSSSSDDNCMEDLALSLPSHSRNHSHDQHFSRDRKSSLQNEWAAFQQRGRIDNIVLDRPPAYQRLDDAPPYEEASPPQTLLTLPPEIRHQIYRHCDELVFKQPLLYCIATAFDKIQHPLAAVSRQVRSEALAIFYSYNTWTVKVEFRMMYEGFQHWIIRLGDGAGSLRLVELSVRGTLFKPKRAHTQSVMLNGQLVQITPSVAGIAPSAREQMYSPPDGDASFKIDLSEKYVGGLVKLVRNDGTKDAGEQGRAQLAMMVEGLWEKRRVGTLNGQDWVTMVDNFITYIGGWVGMI